MLQLSLATDTHTHQGFNTAKTAEDRKQTINEGFEKHVFGVVDTKGRKVGVELHFQVRTYAAIPADSRTWSEVAPGTYYAWLGEAARGGFPFGAGQRWNLCKTEAERTAKARAVKAFWLTQL